MCIQQTTEGRSLKTYEKCVGYDTDPTSTNDKKTSYNKHYLSKKIEKEK